MLLEIGRQPQIDQQSRRDPVEDRARDRRVIAAPEVPEPGAVESGVATNRTQA
jgi:hypothetical protein